MLTLKDLSKRIGACQCGTLSIGDLEEWIEDVSTGEAHDDPRLRQALAAIDGAFSAHHFDLIGEAATKQELANAIRPFEVSGNSVTTRYSDCRFSFA